MSGRCLSLLSVVQALFINLHPWVHPNRNRGWKQGQGGVDGCRAVAPVTTRDLLPACLPSCLSECRSVSSITDRGLLFNKIQTQTGAHAQAHRHRRNSCIEKYTCIEACEGKARGNKGQAVPPSVFIKEKSDQIN